MFCPASLLVVTIPNSFRKNSQNQTKRLLNFFDIFYNNKISTKTKRINFFYYKQQQQSKFELQRFFNFY